MSAIARPIQTTRAWYETTRRKAREQAGPREDRGLPHHPDGSGLAPCAYCNGQGIVERHHWNPQLDKSWPCPECGGMGDIPDGWRDPLLRLRYYRQRRIRRRNPAGYQHMRRVCATPVWQLRLIESAVGCELAARRAVAAWREVA